MKEESLLLLSDLQKLINQVVLIDYTIIILGKRIMVDLYCALIIAGKRKIDTVPTRYRDAVREQLAAVGLDENGNPIQYTTE